MCSGKKLDNDLKGRILPLDSSPWGEKKTCATGENCGRKADKCRTFQVVAGRLEGGKGKRNRDPKKGGGKV